MSFRRFRFLLILMLLMGSGSALAAVAAPAQHPRAGLSDYFTPLDLERSKAYRGPFYALFFGGLAASLATGGVLGLGRGVRWLGDRAAAATGKWALQVLLLAAVVTVATTLVSLPFSYGRYLHDRHWGLSTLKAGAG